MGCGQIAGGGRMFSQCMGSVPSQYLEKSVAVFPFKKTINVREKAMLIRLFTLVF